MRFKNIDKTPDSIDKIIDTYFSVVTTQEFTYNKKLYTPKPYIISSHIFRPFFCPEQCGGCCPKFTLDYIPTEINQMPDSASLRCILFENPVAQKRLLTKQFYVIYSDLQKGNESHFCKYINPKNGRCTIYTKRPFSCDFELIRFLHFKDPKKPNRITTRIFGRGWQYKKVNGELGALCVINPIITPQSIAEVKRKFIRLQEWCKFFELQNSVDKILKWIDEYNNGLVKNELVVRP